MQCVTVPLRNVFTLQAAVVGSVPLAYCVLVLALGRVVGQGPAVVDLVDMRQHLTAKHHRLLCVPDERLQHIAMLYGIIVFWNLISAPYLRPVALETKMADAQVEYKRVDLQSYEARKGASLAQSFKYNFSFPSMYRRLKSTRLIQ